MFSLRSLHRPRLAGAFRRLMKSGPQPSRAFSQPAWATFDPETLSAANPAQLKNLCDGSWTTSKNNLDVVDPLNGDVIVKMPLTGKDDPSELDAFLNSLKKVPKTGLHNPLRGVDRYLLYGRVCAKMYEALGDPEIEDYFCRAIQRVMPKSYVQARNEVRVTRDFFGNFSSDQIRFLAQGFSVSGDFNGQQSNGYRWPYGPVAIISPFNFPLEIPALQLMGALFMGNKPIIKGGEKVSAVLEQLVRLLIHCGMPASDVDLIHAEGAEMEQIVTNPLIRVTQFTGSSRVAELLAEKTHGKIKIEDAGFDWKVLGPDVGNVEYTAWQCDMDAYACSGQKCSAQSILFMHENWSKTNLLEQMEKFASQRKLDDLTIGPVLTHTTEGIIEHTEKLASLPGAHVLFGGKALSGHSIPSIYGAVEPTAVFVPLAEIMKPENFELCTTEIFGPFQVVTEYKDNELESVLEALESMSHHLTAAVVSNDPVFQQRVLGSTVNGTTYVGARARTTAAPQNHWFGPCGDPRGAGIGSPYAILHVWSAHREVISDVGPIPDSWKPIQS